MTQPGLTLLREAVREAVATEGLRAFAERTGVPLGVVRGAQGDQNLTAASIARLSEALGFEFFVGPRRAHAGGGANAGPAAPGLAESPAVFRMSAPGADAWAALDRPAPDGPFFVAAPEGGGAPDGASYCLVEPGAALLPGMTVYVEDREGRVALGRFEGENPANRWLRLRRHGAAMLDERAPESLRRVCPVTWAGQTPPPAAMSDLLAAAEATLARRRAVRRAVDDIVAELRERLLKLMD